MWGKFSFIKDQEKGGHPSRKRASVGRLFKAGLPLLGISTLLFMFPLAGQAEEQKAAASPKRASRIEFDERLIMGQSLKSGAVYLFERKDSEIQSMLKTRKDFRKELLAPFESSQ